MKIKGNVTYKDNIKLVYANIILIIICVFLIFNFYREKNFKPLIVVDSAHEVYHGRMMRVPEQDAIISKVKAHVNMSFVFLYNLSEYNYHEYIEKALHLWGNEGVNVIGDYEKEGLYDLLSSTPTRTECLIKSIEYLGQKETPEVSYPLVTVDPTTEEISFTHQVANNVVTHLVKVDAYKRVIRGSQILSEERHVEELEVYTGFATDIDNNPFGYKSETISREIQKLTTK